MKDAALRANIYIIWLLVVVAASVAVLLFGDPRLILAVSIVYLAYETSISLLFFTLTRFGVRRLLNEKSTALESNSIIETSIVIAAFNEIACINDTLQSLFAQTDVKQQIIICSDGSSDGMNEMLIARFDLLETAPQIWTRAIDAQTTLELLTLPRMGKGAALNHGLDRAAHQILVTLDADTKLETDAIHNLAAQFNNQKVIASGGFIYVRDAARGSWIVFYQYVEFLRNFLWRIGLTNAGVCLQVSGAFGAFRTRTLREVGGFAADSLVEDYEIIYRLHEHFHRARLDYKITIAVDAVAYTDSPKTAAAFIRQRTRWFAGFLQTLWQYRRLIFARRAGRIGLLMLPIKTVDAILPLWGFASLVILLTTLIFGRGTYPLWAAAIFAGKWLFDVTIISLMLRWHQRLFPTRKLQLSTAQMMFCLLTEGFAFQPFRQLAVLNSYSWCVRRLNGREQNKWLTERGQPLSLPEES